MSADNWAACPRCAERRADEIKALDVAIAGAYGTASVEEFDQMRKDREAFVREEMQASFREDYEIYGAEDGVVRVVYSGGCKTCGLGLKFNHEHPLDVTQ